MGDRVISKLARRQRGPWRRAQIAEIASAAILARRTPGLADGARNGSGWLPPRQRREIASLVRQATHGLDAGLPVYDIKVLLGRAIRKLETA